MAPELQAITHAAQSWLQSSWNIQVPSAWLEACVEWLQEEAGGPGRLVQQQVNQQALDQWLLTDLRDLNHPVLPEGLAEAQKTELSGTFCVQVDSVLDISRPAYGQLQKLKGTDCANDEVSAATQATQRPWEAKPTRMLLLQVTDGVQSLEAMEYQSVPALSTALRPGVKLQLRGQMVCRLGVLLLGPSNVKVLGGEVEDLVERNNQGRVLCRTLGLPEDEEQQPQEEEEEAPLAPQQGNQEAEDLDDAELLASLEAQEEVERVQEEAGPDSGYWTFSNTSTQSLRNLVPTISSRSEVSVPSHSSLSSRDGSVSDLHHHHYVSSSDHMNQEEINDHDMEVENFPDEDFDDLPLDELDAVVFQESPRVADSTCRSIQQNSSITEIPSRADHMSRLGSSSSRATTQKRDHHGCTKGATQKLAAGMSPIFSPPASEPPPELEFATNDESDLLDEDMDCFFEEVHAGTTGGPNQPTVQQGRSAGRESCSKKTDTPGSSCRPISDSSRRVTPQRQNDTPCTSTFDRMSAKKDPHGSASALTLSSPPFTYLCLLEETMSKPDFHTTEIRLKAFIVTLLGKLSSSNGVWSVGATISDGTGYLDVELFDEVLTGLLGFSVAQKGILKRDPARRGELDAGMRRCQEELVDMCCIMTVVVKPGGRKAVVTKAEPVHEKMLEDLEQRVIDRKRDQQNV